MIDWYLHKDGFWFRIFGYGILVIRKQDYHPLFSERYSYKKRLWIGQWGFEILKRR
jgi:hypothetical protein